jgi:hypothetical protein
MLLFRCSTGEAWNSLMFAVARKEDVNYACIQDPTYEEI